MPSILGAVILLFGNAFAAYATAYSLTSGSVNIVPILIGAYYSGNVLDNPHLAQALAFGMFVVLAVMMLHLHPAAAARREVGEVIKRPRMAPSAFVWLLLAAAYFIIPLFATLAVQPQVEPDRQVLHAGELQLGDPQRRLLAHAEDLVRCSRSRRS